MTTKRKIALAVVLVILCITASGFIGYWLSGTSASDAFYFSLQHFALAYDSSNAKNADGLSAGLIDTSRFLAIGILFLAVVQIFAERVGRWLTLRLHLFGPGDRDVILGFGPVAQAVGAELHRRGAKVTFVAEPGTSGADEIAERLGGLLVERDPSSEQAYADVRLHLARTIYVARSDEMASLDAAEAARNWLTSRNDDATRWRARRGRKTDVPIRLFSDSPVIQSQLAAASQEGFLCGSGVAVFNMRREAVRAVVLRERWDRVALLLGQDRVHLVIVGGGWQGQALLEETLNLCARAGLNPPLVTILDKNAADVANRLREKAPAFFSEFPVPDWLPPRFVQFDMEKDDFATWMDRPQIRTGDAAGAEATVPVTAWAICTERDETNLRASLSLQQSMARYKVPPASIYARVWDAQGGLSRKLKRNRISMVETFGGLDDALLQTSALDADPDAEAKQLHHGYLNATIRQSPAKHERAGSAHISPNISRVRAERDWDALHVSKQESNRRAFRHAPMKLEDLGLGWRSSDPKLLPRASAGFARQFTEEMEQLARNGFDPNGAPPDLLASVMLEHDRWVIDRALDGWTHAKQRDEAKRHHPLMTHWNDVPKDMRPFDAVLLNALANRSAREAPLAHPSLDLWIDIRHGQIPRANIAPNSWEQATRCILLLPSGHLTRPDKTRVSLNAPWVKACNKALAAEADGNAARLSQLLLVFRAPPSQAIMQLAEHFARLVEGRPVAIHTVWNWNSSAAPEQALSSKQTEAMKLDHRLDSWGIVPKEDHGKRRIGFAGHRRIRGGREALRAALEKSFQEEASKSGTGEAELITGFAPGADRVAVEAWKALGERDVLYLFPYGDPGADNGAAARAWTDDPAKGRGETRVEFARCGILGEQVEIIAAEEQASPHLELAHRLLEDLDCLIIYWNGQRAKGPGGTAHIVKLARERGIEVRNVFAKA